ncbi:MAG TPA: septation protein SepH, partial [Acidimicrobiales bacterium]|nr:septation protein SepH [Acidimicrobiales bacterium]
MQQLHFVGFTAGGDSLVFSVRRGAKSGSYVLPLDEDLLALIADTLRRRRDAGMVSETGSEVVAAVAAAGRRSLLTPREIQARLRAGRSIAQVASEAGVDESWVTRFDAPVAAERAQVVGMVRQFVYSRPRHGESAEVLGTSVRWNLADRGVRVTDDEFDDAWSAFQVADHTWMVTFDFQSRRRTVQARWEVDLDRRDLVSRNRLGTELGYVEPGRRRRDAASLAPDAEPEATPVEAPSRARAAAAKPAPPARSPAAKPASTTTGRGRLATPAKPASATAGRGRAAAPGASASTTAGRGRATTAKPTATTASWNRAAAPGASASTTAGRGRATTAKPTATTASRNRAAAPGTSASATAGRGRAVTPAEPASTRATSTATAADRKRSGRSAIPAATAGSGRKGSGRRT